MQEFIVAVVERPAIRTVGLKVRTTMENAGRDCPQLWDREFKRLCAVHSHPDYAGQTFGASVMVDAETFDYWMVAPSPDGAAVPEGLDVLTLPAGTYAECTVASLERLGAAFTSIYGEWIAGRDDYVVNMQGCCYERYTMDFPTTGALTVYCPLVEK